MLSNYAILYKMMQVVFCAFAGQCYKWDNAHLHILLWVKTDVVCL